MNILSKKFDSIKEHVLTRKANRDSLNRILESYKKDVEDLKSDSADLSNSISIVQSFSGTIRSDVVGRFEQLLTNGVRQIFNKDYKISIEFSNSGNSVFADFYVTLPDGKKISLSSEGGGLRDFVAVLQRILYIVLEPSKPSKVLFLDENLKALDAARSPVAFKFISELLRELDIQAVFITHSDSARNILDGNVNLLEVFNDGQQANVKQTI
jgi:DNA repair exonuclease SbcCD ATPase subunit